MADLLATTFRFRVALTPALPRTDPADHGVRATQAEAARPGRPPASSPLGDGAFQECSGLDMEMDVAEYLEGGRNNGVIQRAGRVKVSRIVLKRGMLHPADGTVSTDLWQWFQDVVDGVRPLRRYDGTVDVLGAAGRVVATWAFARGLPVKIVGPQLNAKTGDVAVEELQIAHEGLRLVVA